MSFVAVIFLLFLSFFFFLRKLQLYGLTASFISHIICNVENVFARGAKKDPALRRLWATCKGGQSVPKSTDVRLLGIVPFYASPDITLFRMFTVYEIRPSAKDKQARSSVSLYTCKKIMASSHSRLTV